MPLDLLAPVKPGDPIRADTINELIARAKSFRGFANGFSNSGGTATRVISRQSAGIGAIYGLLKFSVPAGGIVEDAIEAVAREGGGFSVLYEEDDVTPLKYGAHNMNGYTNINIYEDGGFPIKQFVWGFPFTYNFGTEAEPTIKTVLEIWNPPMEPGMTEGFVKAPVNSVGQVYMHNNGSNKGVSSAGPCGGG